MDHPIPVRFLHAYPSHVRSWVPAVLLSFAGYVDVQIHLEDLSF